MRIGRYTLEERIGVGGYGEVWRGWLEGELGFRKPVAVKLMRSPEVADSLLNEALIGARMQHPNIVNTYEFTRVGDQYLMAMELIVGEGVEALIARSPSGVDPPVAVRVVRQVAEGLAYAHGLRDDEGELLGLVHRDLKPANLMLDGTGAARILDFGIARVAAAARVTAPGKIRGTLQYLAPEVAEGDEASTASDMWALGAIAYELATGKHLIEGQTVHQTLIRITQTDPETSATEAEEFVPALGPVVRRCLDPDPLQRPTAAEVRDALPHLESGSNTDTLDLVHAHRRDVGPLPQSAFRRPVIALIAIVVAVALAGGILAGRALAPAPAGGTLTVAVPLPRGTLDLFNRVNTMGRRVWPLVLEHPVLLDEDGVAQPALVASWSHTPDHRSWTLEVDPTRRFHPHPCLPKGGRPANADDLRFSLQLAQDEGHLRSPIRALSIENGNLRVTFQDPAPFLLPELARVWVLPAELESCDDVHNLQQPVGTGPFRFAGPARDERLELVRNEDWSGPDGPVRLAGLVFRHEANPENALAGIRSGAFDAAVLADPLPPDALAGPDIVMAEAPNRDTVTPKGLLVFRERQGLLSEPEVRRAVAIAIDREAIHSAQTRNRFVPSARFLLPTHLGYDPARPPIRHDPTAAREALAAFEAQGDVLLGAYEGDLPLAEVWATQLTDVGLPTRVVELAPSSLQASLEEPPVDMALLELTSSTWGVDPWPMLTEMVSALREVSHVSADLAAINARIRAEPDRQERAALYAELEAALLDELPLIPVGFVDDQSRADAWLVGRRVRGLLEPGTQFVRQGPVPALAVSWVEPI